MKILIFFLNLLDFINKKKVINFFKKETSNINIFIDVGAHEGETSNLFSKYLNIKKIYCFEPSSINFNNLKKKIVKKENIFLFNFGLGDRDGERDFNQLEESSSSTLVELNKKSKYFLKKKKNSKPIYKKKI